MSEELLKAFKFQSDSINTFSFANNVGYTSHFKFQSDSINTETATKKAELAADFKFQSDSINTFYDYIEANGMNVL